MTQNMFHRQKETQTVLEQLQVPILEAKYTDQIMRFWVHLGDFKLKEMPKCPPFHLSSLNIH